MEPQENFNNEDEIKKYIDELEVIQSKLDDVFFHGHDIEKDEFFMWDETYDFITSLPSKPSKKNDGWYEGHV